MNINVALSHRVYNCIFVHTLLSSAAMRTARVFTNGNRQAGWTAELGYGRLDVGAAVAAAKAHA